ncbi:MAG: hypothetical protein JO360_06395, partial [Acidobacteria bacterium]|nr:hypothetical protein [Acidobacteriota bacterium]
MQSQTTLKMMLALAAMLLFVLACNAGDETEKANKLVSEGNAAIEEGNKQAIDAGAKNDKIFDELSAANFEADKERLSPQAKDAVAGMTKSADKFREASKKFDEASKLKI